MNANIKHEVRISDIGIIGTLHQTRIHVSLSLSTIESLFDLAKYGDRSGEAAPGSWCSLYSLMHCSHVIHPSLARKRTGDAEIGWRPAPEKNIETMPCWGKNSPENCLVDLGRDARTRTQSRRLVRRKGASWSLNWPSGANLLAHLELKCILLCASVTAVYLPFFVFGRVLTRLD